MSKKVVKTHVGDFDVETLTWKQIKEAKIFGLIQRLMSAGTDDIMTAISDDDIDRVVSVVAGDKKDELTFSEVMDIFNAVLEAASDAKK